MYNPAPIDTSGIELPVNLLQLTEEIAKMFMKFGPPVVSVKAGNGVQSEMIKKRKRHALFPMRS